MSAIEWVFKMRDQVSDPAKGASAALSNFIQTTHSALAIVQLLGQGAMTAGRMIAAGIAPAVTKEKTLGAFETILGSATDAVKLYQEAVAFANETPFETQGVVQSFKQLLTAQFEKEDLTTVVRIVGDAASMAQFPEEAMATVNRQLGQMKAKGKLTAEDLMPIAEATSMSQVKLLENLAKIYGVTVEEAQKMRESGQVKGDEGVFAILQTLQQQFGGNMKRSSTQVQGLWSTIASMPTTYLEELKDTKGYEALRQSLVKIIQVFDPAATGGKNLSETITTLGSGILERVAEGLERSASAAMAFADGWRIGFTGFDEAMGQTDPERAAKYAENMKSIGTAAGMVATGIIAIGGALKSAYEWLQDIGDWMKKHPWAQRIFNPAGALAEAYTSATQTKGAFGLPGGEAGYRERESRILAAATDAERSSYQSLKGMGREFEARGSLKELEQRYFPNRNVARGFDLMGESASQGYSEGFSSSLAYQQGFDMAAASVEGAQEALDSHSPSRVFEDLGRSVPAGYQKGVESGSEEAQGAVMGMTQAPARGTAPSSIAIDMSNMTVHAQTEKDARAIAQTIYAQVEAGLYATLERLALQAGRV